MCRVMDVMILREGCRFLFKTSYKPVESCSQIAEIPEGSLKNFYPRPLNQFEYENLLQREKNVPDYFPLEELDSQYITKRFKLEKIATIEAVSKYLLTVTDLANDILKCLAENVTKLNDLKAAGLKGDNRKYHNIKNTLLCFIDICGRTRIARRGICNSDASRMAAKYFDQLESDFNFTLSLSPVPDEIVSSIGETFQSVSLIRFSDKKKLGIKENTLIKEAENMCNRLYSTILCFVHGLIDEFSYYVCPEEFINNPTYDALFVIPDDMYTSFNFSQGGLCLYEKQALDTGLNYEKSVFKNTLKFYSEVRTYLEDILKMSKKVNKEIKELPNDNVIERFLQEYKDEFWHTTEGKIKDIEEMLENSAGFREKLTALLTVMNSGMLDALDNHKKPWGIERKNGESANNLYVILIIWSAYFGKKKVFPQAQFQRVFSIFNEYSNPQESMSHNYRSFRDGKLKWRKIDKEQYIDLVMN